MPRISAFYGIGIWMYWNEGVHMRPHFHAPYAGIQASIAFDGQLIVGSLPARALRLVRDWAALHQAELQDNWKRALDGVALRKIDPLP
jgi:hypothetical protein